MDINEKNIFQNKIIDVYNDVKIINEKNKFTDNFSKQWKTYQYSQIDEKNSFKITYNFLKKLFFNNLEVIGDKEIIEFGCGSGRFTEYFSKLCKNCVSVDLSESVFFNDYRKKNNVEVYKADFTKLFPKKKFDIVFCRGVLQHTEDPDRAILKLFEFVKKDGIVVFDYYSMPKIKYLHPKYLYWRPLFKNLIKYESYEKFLNKNISKLLKIKRFIDKIFFKKYFISDCIIPLWDVGNIIPNNEKINYKKICELSILDTLDGLYAFYDRPKSNKNLIKFLKKNNLKIINNNKDLNCFIVSI